MVNGSRRTFFKLAGAGLAAATALDTVVGNGRTAAQTSPKAKIPFELGMASYTFRKFKLEDCLAMTKRLGLKKIAFKDFHLALNSTEAEIKAVVQKVVDSGLDLYGCGVVYMRSEDQVKQAFDYAKAAGMRVIIGVPEHNLLKLVDDKVKEYKIKVAIHNHGPGDKVYPTPQTVYDRIKDLDSRIGLCIDIGHTQRSGVDPSEAARAYANRLYDIHIKDVTAPTGEGSTLEMGRGIIDIPKFMKTLIKINYTGMASLEYEKDADDPLAGAAESIGYTRGVLAAIA